MMSMLQELVSGLRTQLPETEILARLVAAVILGAVIGLDRELQRHPAGLRTHMLTSLAAVLFTVLTFELYYEVRSTGATNSDPIRIVEAVTAGVAFLAAGAIIQSRGQVHGLTTGASMWLAGAVGLACGAGFYTIAGFAAILALVILTLLKWVQRRLFPDENEPVRPHRKPAAGELPPDRPA
jgi:putative Mg2+ transporter-C (MgtC) family protein